LTFFLVATLLVGVSAVAQEVGRKDLTKVGANPLEHKKFKRDSSCDKDTSTGMGGSPCHNYPFELSLLSANPREVQIGGEMIASLRLRNVGYRPASVPWITDPDRIELPDAGGYFRYSESRIVANITSEAGGGAYFFMAVRLYGAEEIPGSLQEIRPGEYVELKIKLVLDCETDQLHCRSLRAGPAKLSFTWINLELSDTYKKCGIESRLITRSLEADSDATAIGVLERAASQ
jgi:hypothetical protein